MNKPLFAIGAGIIGMGIGMAIGEAMVLKRLRDEVNRCNGTSVLYDDKNEYVIAARRIIDFMEINNLTIDSCEVQELMSSLVMSNILESVNDMNEIKRTVILLMTAK